jgi:hypothetical protein
MWILDFLPDAVIHFLVLAGAAGTVAGFLLGVIPFIAMYRIPIQVISILVLTLGIYLEGGLSNQKEWKIKMAELEAENERIKAEGAKINTEIVTKIVTKKQVIKEKGEEVVRYIDREVVKYDASCPIPSTVIAAHDAAARNATVVDLTEIDAAAKSKPKPAIRLPVK